MPGVARRGADGGIELVEAAKPGTPRRTLAQAAHLAEARPFSQRRGPGALEAERRQ